MDLQTSRASARIALEGGRLASLVVDGMELLVTDAPKPTRWGSFPMVPWCGRLPFGELQFNGETHTFPITSAPHANHGTAMHSTWQVTAGNEASDPSPANSPATSLSIETPLTDPWPWGGSVRQHFTLDDTSFTVHMEVHADTMTMPAQMGWHPWYRRQLDRGAALQVEFAADSIYETDAEQIPTGQIIAAPNGPWDETFVGVTQTPILHWPGALSVALTSNFDHWVVFTELDHAVAIEPQSGAPNDLNRAPHVLAPGDVLEGWMKLSWG